MNTKVIVTHNGKDYEGQIGTIRKTRFGVEDHGCLTANLDITFPGGGIGVGGYALDSWDEAKRDRIGTAYGLDHLAQIMHTVGVSNWEDLPGKQVIVLYSGSAGWGGMSVGIASTTEDRAFILEDHAAEWKGRQR